METWLLRWSIDFKKRNAPEDVKQMHFTYVFLWCTYSNAERPEMTYSEQATTWNELQQARNDLDLPTTSKAKDAEQPKMSKSWDYFTIWRNISLQSFKLCFMENHGKNRASHTCYRVIHYRAYLFQDNLRMTLILAN